MLGEGLQSGQPASSVGDLVGGGHSRSLSLASMCGGGSVLVLGAVIGVGAAVALGGCTFSEGSGLRAIRALRRKKKVQEDSAALLEEHARKEEAKALQEEARPKEDAAIDETAATHALLEEAPEAVVEEAPPLAVVDEQVPADVSAEAEARCVVQSPLIAVA